MTTSKYPLWAPNTNDFLLLFYDQYVEIKKSPSSKYVWIAPSVTQDDRINSVSSFMTHMNHKGCWTYKRKCTGRFETTWLEGRGSLWVIAGLSRSGKWRRDESWRYPAQWGCKKCQGAQTHYHFYRITWARVWGKLQLYFRVSTELDFAYVPNTVFSKSLNFDCIVGQVVQCRCLWKRN